MSRIKELHNSYYQVKSRIEGIKDVVSELRRKTDNLYQLEHTLEEIYKDYLFELAKEKINITKLDLKDKEKLSIEEAISFNRQEIYYITARPSDYFPKIIEESCIERNSSEEEILNFLNDEKDLLALCFVSSSIKTTKWFINPRYLLVNKKEYLLGRTETIKDEIKEAKNVIINKEEELIETLKGYYTEVVNDLIDTSRASLSFLHLRNNIKSKKIIYPIIALNHSFYANKETIESHAVAIDRVNLIKEDVIAIWNNFYDPSCGFEEINPIFSEIRKK